MRRPLDPLALGGEREDHPPSDPRERLRRQALMGLRVSCFMAVLRPAMYDRLRTNLPNSVYVAGRVTADLQYDVSR